VSNAEARSEVGRSNGWRSSLDRGRGPRNGRGHIGLTGCSGVRVSGARTKEGIGIGSTFGELGSKYTIDWIGSGEGSVFARVETLAISFELDNTGPTRLSAVRDPAKVPLDVRIVGMLLTR